MQEFSTSTAIPTNAIKAEALASMSASFERFCLAAGLEALAEMMEQDALGRDWRNISGVGGSARAGGGGAYRRARVTVTLLYARDLGLSLCLSSPMRRSAIAMPAAPSVGNGQAGAASSDVTAAIDAVKADGKNLRLRG